LKRTDGRIQPAKLKKRTNGRSKGAKLLKRNFDKVIKRGNIEKSKDKKRNKRKRMGRCTEIYTVDTKELV
jgi:hypothetical protein